MSDTVLRTQSAAPLSASFDSLPDVLVPIPALEANDNEASESGGGATLTITSMAGENKNERIASYSSSKTATNHLIRNIAFDLGPKNIRINRIAPGAVRTDALAKVLTDGN